MTAKKLKEQIVALERDLANFTRAAQEATEAKLKTEGALALSRHFLSHAEAEETAHAEAARAVTQEVERQKAVDELRNGQEKPDRSEAKNMI